MEHNLVIIDLMAPQHSEVITVPGEAEQVFPALIEAARLAGKKLVVHEPTLTVRAAKGSIFLMGQKDLTCRILDSQNGATTIELKSEIKLALFDLWRMNKSFVSSVKGHLLQLLGSAQTNPQQAGSQPTPPAETH